MRLLSNSGTIAPTEDILRKEEALWVGHDGGMPESCHSVTQTLMLKCQLTEMANVSLGDDVVGELEVRPS